MNGGDNGTNTGRTIGRTLELARKQRGLSLEQVEEATKIRTGYLRDLERENFDVLPAVYVHGSLRTYANFLHLDAEAMVQELKRRQAPEEKPPYPLYVGPPQEEDSLDDLLKAAGGTEKSRAATEEDRTRDAAPPLLPAGYLYLASAVFVILVVAAVVVAFNAARDSQPAVSQVREPLISRAPETTPPGAGEVAHVPSPPQNDKEQSADDEKDKPQRSAGSEAKDEKPNQAASAASQNSPSATATASAAPQKEKQKATAEPDEAAAQPSRSTPSNTRASAPARQTAPPSSARPAGQPKGSRSGDGGQTRVKVVVGGKDPVKLSGGPFDD